jgi:allophanate hydrolase subunit 1
LELESNASVHAVARTARQLFGDALEEVVPGHVTVLLVWNQAVPSAEALGSDLNVLARSASTFESDMEPFGSSSAGSVAIPVIYDGPDLERVAQTLGLGVEALIALHQGMVFRVAFMGFAPGFPYLIADVVGADVVGADVVGADVLGADVLGADVRGDGGSKPAQLLALARMATPRPEVPAGSVAVAAGYCGIYPRRSPGGWNLLGRTDAVLFDAARERPALLVPGVEVRFAAA